MAERPRATSSGPAVSLDVDSTGLKADQHVVKEEEEEKKRVKRKRMEGGGEPRKKKPRYKLTHP